MNLSIRTQLFLTRLIAREAVARAKAVLRRRVDPEAPRPGRLILKKDRLRASAGENGVELTVVEFALLETLYSAPGRIFSRDRLMACICADRRVVSDRTIDSHVTKLRRTLADIVPDQDPIHSVHGVGYRCEERETESAPPP